MFPFRANTLTQQTEPIEEEPKHTNGTTQTQKTFPLGKSLESGLSSFVRGARNSNRDSE